MSGTTFSRAAERYGLEIVRLPMSNGMWTSAERATCSTCERTEDVIHSNKASHIPPDIVVKKLKQRGWLFRGKKATCPFCAAEQRGREVRAATAAKPTPSIPSPVPGKEYTEIWFDEAQTIPEEMPTMADQNVVQIDAAPRAPTREQKRRIHQEIEGNWDERAGRYIGSASDQAIADGLHVPRAWVVDIRADFFGDSGENADIAAFKAELATRIEDVEKLVENAMTSAASFDAVLKEMKALKTRLERIEKSVLPKR